MERQKFCFLYIHPIGIPIRRVAVGPIAPKTATRTPNVGEQARTPILLHTSSLDEFIRLALARFHLCSLYSQLAVLLSFALALAASRFMSSSSTFCCAICFSQYLVSVASCARRFLSSFSRRIVSRSSS